MNTTSLCSHINTIYGKLVQLENQAQTLCLYPHSQTDSVQINAPEYDPDIDGQTERLPDLQSHAENNREEPTITTGDSEDSGLLQNTIRTDPEPEAVQNSAEDSLHQNAEPFCEQYQDTQQPQLDTIPQLEDEDWEDGQFIDADLIDHHNARKESEHIR